MGLLFFALGVVGLISVCAWFIRQDQILGVDDDRPEHVSERDWVRVNVRPMDRRTK